MPPMTGNEKPEMIKEEKSNTQHCRDIAIWDDIVVYSVGVCLREKFLQCFFKFIIYRSEAVRKCGVSTRKFGIVSG